MFTEKVVQALVTGNKKGMPKKNPAEEKWFVKKPKNWPSTTAQLSSRVIGISLLLEDS